MVCAPEITSLKRVANLCPLTELRFFGIKRSMWPKAELTGAAEPRPVERLVRHPHSESSRRKTLTGRPP